MLYIYIHVIYIYMYIICTKMNIPEQMFRVEQGNYCRHGAISNSARN